MTTWTKTYFKKRFFLNKDLTRAAAFWGHVTLDYDAADPTSSNKWAQEDRYELAASMDLSDCSRIISLDFDLYNGSAQDAREMREKVTRLVTAVNGFGTAYLKALDDMEGKVTKKP